MQLTESVMVEDGKTGNGTRSDFFFPLWFLFSLFDELTFHIPV